MRKKLPGIYQAPLDKKVDHNKDVFYSFRSSKEQNQNLAPTREVFGKEENSVQEEIGRVFHSTRHSFNIPVTFTTKEKTYHTKLIGKAGNYILTRDEEEVNIDDILTFHIEK